MKKKAVIAVAAFTALIVLANILPSCREVEPEMQAPRDVLRSQPRTIDRPPTGHSRNRLLVGRLYSTGKRTSGVFSRLTDQLTRMLNSPNQHPHLFGPFHLHPCCQRT